MFERRENVEGENVMRTTHATDNGPFEFTDFRDKQTSVPLSVRQFANGTLSVDASEWKLFSNRAPDDQTLTTTFTEERK